MATNENLIPIPGRLHSVTTEGHVAGADEIFDDSLNKDQATINQEVNEAIGTGGSVDSRIAAAINALDASVSKSAGADGLALSVTEENGKVTAINGSIASNTYDSYGSASAAQSAAISAAATDATTKVNAAKSEIKGNATSACDTLGKAEALISAEATARQSAISNVIGDAASDYNTLGKLEDKIQAEATRAEVAEEALDGRVDTLEEAVGSGGSVDERIAEAVENAAFLGANDGSAVIADFDPQTDTVWKKAQTLSAAEKEQVQQNIGVREWLNTLTGEKYVSVAATDQTTTSNLKALIDTAAGSAGKEQADTIYRIGKWDGSAYNEEYYSDYAWDGSAYVQLNKKSIVGEVFDITEYKDGTKYADLAAALGTNGENVPQNVRKGGMSVKYVNTDNKYVQYRLMSDTFNTTVANWQGVDDEPIARSNNLVKSCGVYPIAQKLSNVTFIPSSSIEEHIIQFLTDNGIFVSQIDPSGIKSIDYKIKIGDNYYTIGDIYSDPLNNDSLNFFIGDSNGFNIVQFIKGHIQTKNFDSAVILQQISELQEEIAHIQPTESLPTLRKNDFLKDFFAYKFGKHNSSWYERMRIIHYSDTHTNLANLSEAIKLSQGLVHLIVDTGDNANGVVATPATNTITELQQYADTEITANTTPMPLLICSGNHDVPNLTKKQYYDIMSAIVAQRIPSFSFGDVENYRTYGYVDITPNATIGTVRVISLDPFDYDDGQFMNPYGQTGRGGWMNCVFSQAQITWLITTLRSAANNGYKVITCMHYSWGDNTVFTDSGSANPDANYHQDPFMIPDIINAMQQRTSLSKNYPDDCNINNIVVNEDFSNLTNPLHFICHLFGHIHSENEYQCQKTDGSQFYDILMVGAPNMGSIGTAINKVKLQGGTYQSIKCTALEIDTVEQTIYRVNYGGYKAFDMSVVDRTKKISYRFNV